ncbi:MAG: response regulator [Armatimonadota bacterium]|nr:response regulator [Armatimonadota bacterium]
MAKPSILIVDDEPQVLSLLTEALERNEYQTFGAQNAETALELLKKKQIDVIFLDLRMPATDGAQTLERIRETHPTTPVVIITAYPRDLLVDRAMKLGAFACLIKPFSMADVLAILDVLEIEKAA